MILIGCDRCDATARLAGTEEMYVDVKRYGSLAPELVLDGRGLMPAGWVHSGDGDGFFCPEHAEGS